MGLTPIEWLQSVDMTQSLVELSRHYCLLKNKPIGRCSVVTVEGKLPTVVTCAGGLGFNIYKCNILARLIYFKKT